MEILKIEEIPVLDRLSYIDGRDNSLDNICIAKYKLDTILFERATEFGTIIYQKSFWGYVGVYYVAPDAPKVRLNYIYVNTMKDIMLDYKGRMGVIKDYMPPKLCEQSYCWFLNKYIVDKKYPLERANWFLARHYIGAHGMIGRIASDLSVNMFWMKKEVKREFIWTFATLLHNDFLLRHNGMDFERYYEYNLRMVKNSFGVITTAAIPTLNKLIEQHQLYAGSYIKFEKMDDNFCRRGRMYESV